MTPARASRLAPLYGWDLWYDPAIRSWTLTSSGPDYREALYLSPAGLRKISESAFRDFYLMPDQAADDTIPG